MSIESEAAHEIRRLGNQYKAMSDLADSIDRLGSIKDAAKEAEAERAIAEKALEQAKAELADNRKKLKDAKADAIELLLEANKAAKVGADDTLATAKAKAQGLIDKAEAKAAAIDKASEADQFAAAAQYEQIMVSIAAKKAALADLTEAATAKHAEVDALKAELEAMRAKFLGV